MRRWMIVKASDWIPHPEGIFLGRITAIEPTSRFVEGIPEKTFVIQTQPVHGGDPTRSIRHQIYCIWSSTSQFSRMSRAISGKEVPIDAGLSTKGLIGRQGTLEVKHYLKENGHKGHRITQWWPHKNVSSA